MVSEPSHVLNPSCLLFCLPLGQHQLTHQFHLVLFNNAVGYSIDETAFASFCIPDESTMLDRSRCTRVKWLLTTCITLIGKINDFLHYDVIMTSQHWSKFVLGILRHITNDYLQNEWSLVIRSSSMFRSHATANSCTKWVLYLSSTW